MLRANKGGDPEKVRESERRRYQDPAIVDRLLGMDEELIKLKYALEQKQKDVSSKSKTIGQKKKNNEDTKELQAEVVAVKEGISALEKQCDELEAKRDTLFKTIGNIVHDSVPVSKNEDENRVEVVHGPTNRKGTEKHHHEVLWMIDGYSPEQGVSVAGHRAYFLKGCGVLLNQALINYGLSLLMKRGYTALQPPYFMNKEVMAETAQLSEFDEALYKVIGENNEEKYLIATSEQPISAYHRGEWIEPPQLPLRYAGFSSCFRKEAGGHGKDVWGIFRIHQFEKVEQFVVTHPSKSWEMQDEMIQTAQEFYKSLGLSYRVINIVSGALNNAAAKKLDLEAWFPALGVYRELVSCSNCTDYQARAMDTRLAVTNTKEKQYVHMLNATLCATERTICCILENYQTDKGVVVPEVLRPFMGGMDFIPFVKEAPPKAKEAPAKGKKDDKKQ